MEDEIVTVEQAAEMLKVNPSYIRKLVRQGELPVIRRGKRYARYRKSDLMAFLDRYTIRKEVQS
jgi:excisionase family DNA binding protein